MSFYELTDLDERTILPGFHARFVHTDRVTISHWRVEQGATLPEHAHPHEQITMVTEGVFEMAIEGDVHRLEPGSLVTIPGGIVHSGRAVTDCRIIDVFAPPRDDYR